MRYYYEVFGRLKGSIGTLYCIYFVSDRELGEIEMYDYFQDIHRKSCYRKPQTYIIKEVLYTRQYKELDEIKPYYLRRN